MCSLPSGHQQLSIVGLPTRAGALISAESMPVHIPYNTVSKLSTLLWHIRVFSLSALGLASHFPEETGALQLPVLRLISS